ncbi:TetR/AcrR family transcriptional regulator [Streptomyces resistomycificus]|uniref:TetR family transcriptional regulator n=1 Tax=Streptomyces resistomycificus TaxID=67356 RepID=A0A0L8KWD5_9ACTN|nr:TetR/AcrR family transcriptional regulator [Streptomyces resistomycificus]KOG30069.1 TetR family transcriptional regulator [Streptomyces resistomycificus]KUN94842.1 TetR family transcriptional regulator [Streptomyces resistomycificus]
MRLTDCARRSTPPRIRQRAILDTAAAMLEEMPVSAVSLNELSRRVGLAKSNVLRYFESREAVLLELLDHNWRRWTAELPAQLDAAIASDATAQQRGQAFAAVLTRSVAQNRVLCDLLSAQAGVLEHNVSADVAARYKRSALDNVAALAALARRHLPELGDRAGQLSAQAVMVIGAVWTHARPSAAMLAAYAADPSLAALRMDFTGTLEEMLATLVAGTTARAEG